MTISPIKTPQEMLLQEAGIPSLKGGKSVSKAHMQAQLAMKAQQPRYAPENPIVGYRADNKKPGQIETLPTTFDKDKISKYVDAYREAKNQFDLPDFTPKDLVNRLLVEGRSDFGFNSLDKNDKGAQKIASTLLDNGHEDLPAGFAGAIYNKQRLANAHNVPFDVAWNGEGRSKDTGLTGWDYHDRMQKSAFAADNPKNAPLLQHVTSLMQDPVSDDAQFEALQKQNAELTAPLTGSSLFAKGGKVKPFHDMSRLLIQKHLGK